MRARRVVRERFALNLSRAVAALSADDIAEGRLWWPRAAAEVGWLADMHGLPYRTVALAAAALSPGLRWAATLDVLRDLLDARRAGLPTFPRDGHATFGFRDRAKAWAIIHGGPASLCRGPKVEAVAANLLGDLSAVAVDRHIVRAATATDMRQVHPVTSAKIAQSLRLLALIHGMQPAELQAALWVHGAVE